MATLPISLAIAAVLAAATVAVRAEAAAWRLVWSDEFDYQGLPDPAKWSYEEGFVRNREAQFYTRARRENARVEGGHLVIEARRERIETPDYDAAAPRAPFDRPGADYSSASLTTLGKAAWTYGRFEIRARLPHGLGIWPAAWMMGVSRARVSWPACGEIDIMEYVGHTAGRIHATTHYPMAGRPVTRTAHLDVDPSPELDFHVYALEWSPERMDFFYDGRKYHSFAVADSADPAQGGWTPFDKPHYLLLNLALGGTWGGEIDDAVLPQRYLIDYVRVYQRR